MDYMTQDPNAGYTPEQFGQWYQQTYGQQASPEAIQQIGAQVGAPGGPDGRYSAAQWQQGQAAAPGVNQALQAKQADFFPEFQAPTFDAGPAYQAPAAFQAPTMDQAMADPGYQFSLNQGMKAIEGSAAARGLARTGGTLKDLMGYGQQAAAQQYDKVYNRAADQYAQNYQIGRDAWRDNDAQRSGAFDRNYRGAQDQFNARFRGQELRFQDLYNRWNTNVNTQTQLALAE
jgi:hypothetical protein